MTIGTKDVELSLARCMGSEHSKNFVACSMKRHRIFLPTPCQASPPFPRFLGTLTPTSTYYGIRPRNLLHDSRLIVVHHTRIKEKLLSLSSEITISFCTEDSRYFAGARRSLQAFQPSGYCAEKSTGMDSSLFTRSL